MSTILKFSLGLRLKVLPRIKGTMEGAHCGLLCPTEDEEDQVSSYIGTGYTFWSVELSSIGHYTYIQIQIQKHVHLKHLSVFKTKVNTFPDFLFLLWTCKHACNARILFVKRQKFSIMLRYSVIASTRHWPFLIKWHCILLLVVGNRRHIRYFLNRHTTMIF